MSPPASRGGFRPPTPAATDMVRWPESFGTRFVLMVDTEEEFDWTRPPRRGARAVTAVTALPDAHRRFRDRGVPVTYMIDHPIVADARARDTLSSVLAQGGAAIGTQLHPWVNPPYQDMAVAGDSYAGNLPRSVEAAKIDVLTRAIHAAFGSRPRAYRAGRYGLGPASLALLAEHGYRLDSSMRARYDFRADGGPDYRAIGPEAFRTGPGGALLELPPTTIFTGRWRARGEPLYRRAGGVPRGRGVLARLGLLARVALTPEDMPLADALAAVRVAVAEGVRVLNFAFHSPSLVPGHTPYVRSADDLLRFWRWWDAILAELDRLGVRPATLDEVIDAADAAR